MVFFFLNTKAQLVTNEKKWSVNIKKKSDKMAQRINKNETRAF